MNLWYFEYHRRKNSRSVRKSKSALFHQRTDSTADKWSIFIKVWVFSSEKMEEYRIFSIFPSCKFKENRVGQHPGPGPYWRISFSGPRPLYLDSIRVGSVLPLRVLCPAKKKTDTLPRREAEWTKAKRGGKDQGRGVKGLTRRLVDDNSFERTAFTLTSLLFNPLGVKYDLRVWISRPAS